MFFQEAFVRDRFEFDRETPSGGTGSVLSGSVAYDVAKYAQLRSDLEAPYVPPNGVTAVPRAGGPSQSQHSPSRVGPPGAVQRGGQRRILEVHSDNTQQANGHAFQKARVQLLRAEAHSEPSPRASPSLSSDVTISVGSLQRTYESGDTDVTVSNLLSLQSQLSPRQASGRAPGPGPGTGQRVFAAPIVQGPVQPLGERTSDASALEQWSARAQFQQIDQLTAGFSRPPDLIEFLNGPAYQNGHMSQPAPTSPPHMYSSEAAGAVEQQPAFSPSARAHSVPPVFERAAISPHATPRRSVSPTSTVSTDTMGAASECDTEAGNDEDEREPDQFAATTASAAIVVHRPVDAEVSSNAQCNSTVRVLYGLFDAAVLLLLYHTVLRTCVCMCEYE